LGTVKISRSSFSVSSSPCLAHRRARFSLCYLPRISFPPDLCPRSRGTKAVCHVTLFFRLRGPAASSDGHFLVPGSFRFFSCGFRSCVSVLTAFSRRPPPPPPRVNFDFQVRRPFARKDGLFFVTSNSLPSSSS